MECVDRSKSKKRKEEVEEHNDEDFEPVDSEGIPDAAKSNCEKNDETATEDEFGAKDYRSQMILKPDNVSRPLWVVSYMKF